MGAPQPTRRRAWNKILWIATVLVMLQPVPDGLVLTSWRGNCHLGFDEQKFGVK
jgi:hypothetical protein